MATKPIWRLDVESSNIKRVAYNVAKNKMLVEFHSGSRYVYLNVPVEDFVEFTLAESQGKYFVHHIKSHRKHKRLDKES